ncbi:CpsB/CapC family capsule biosynthesis tyrosine phosphatase [Flavobacterium sp.]|uniref:tyrosine-protein phosphatase n=1 Tax=Flavobacterium sp. TaxID=239 RepID=UPI0026202DB9|nr:CpsB/CapC family capsule biosynthesis tyrosine phosphatase [Flavobacterium sp.]
MFFFKKNKPVLSDLIPNDFVDIHSHLLPGIDDGSKDIETTIEMIQALKSIGFSKFITTPHVMEYVWKNSKNDILENHKKTASLLIENNIQTPFNVGAEYMMDDHFRELFQNETLLTLKDNFVLVEMSYINAPLNLYDILFDLQVAGYQPILAHPERYNFYHNNVKEYHKLKTVGCKFQLNLLSSVGYYNPQVAKIADYLLENNLIDFVGSDTHHMKHVAFFNNKIVLKNHQKLSEVIQNNSFFNF